MMRRFLNFWPLNAKKSVRPAKKETRTIPPALTPEQEVLRFLEQEVKREDLIELMLPGLFRERRERIATIQSELSGIREELDTLYRRREETLKLARGSGSSDPQDKKLEGEI